MTGADRPTVRPGVVSVVVVNYRGADDTIECVHSLQGLDWPADRLEIVVVENASPDDSADRLRSGLPSSVVLLESASNTGFAGGCNLGVARATGEFIAFLNNDARPDPGWVTKAVEVMTADQTVGCVASKVLDWDGKKVDYVDGSMTWFGMGYKREVGLPASRVKDIGKDVLFATGAAMFVRAELFRGVGGFDERFFMFYEDVDLGWRLNLLGHRVRYEPTSVAFHKHHATMSKFAPFREEYLLERNALMMIYKNYEDVTLARVLPAAMALAVRRSLVRGGVDAAALDLQRTSQGDDSASMTVSKSGMAGGLAIGAFLDQLSGLAAERSRLQGDRVRSDQDLLPLFGRALEPAYSARSYRDAHAVLVDVFGIRELFDPESGPRSGAAGRFTARAPLTREVAQVTAALSAGGLRYTLGKVAAQVRRRATGGR